MGALRAPYGYPVIKRMNFYTHARKVRRLDLSFVQRRNAFGNCIESYSYFCRDSFQALYARFAAKFGFDNETPDTDARLLRALDALQAERAQKLARLRLFKRWGARQKRAGRRELSASERQWLDAIRRGEKSAPNELRLAQWLDEMAENRGQHPLARGLGGCLVGGLVGAVVGPFLFALALAALDWMAPATDPDAGEGLLFWTIPVALAGALAGAVTFPIGRELVEMIRDEIKGRSTRNS